MMKRLYQTLLGLSFIFLALCCSEKKKIQSRFSFVKTVAADSLNEPMQMAELPDGKLVFIERHGAIKLYDPAARLLSTAHRLAVVDSLEDGLMGLAIDPKWSENHWIYLYYSPLGAGDVNRLSRFVFDENHHLDPASENPLFEVKVQRQECCHSGGGLLFDDDGYLYLGTGDNTNPTDDYAVVDERPGRSPWDAQKSSANTFDLRGKILRIKPLPDGAYICPAGNLFTDKDLQLRYARDSAATLSTKDAENAAATTETSLKGRPEIYIMGCRNPFRMSFDLRRRLLFWGDIGPDASVADTARGPAGYDEINRAAAAGNYGWPYFIADNKAYRDYNFETKKSGPPFDPAHPFNDSPNNTGARALPPAQPAIIWYPYGFSPEFPLLAEQGSDAGRNAMAGPVYYADRYPAETRLPDHYDGKLFIYDWMRNQIMAVGLDAAGNYRDMEHFADDVQLVCPMDMLIDRNGTMWVLEYGTERYSANPDARLSRIDLVRENRPPVPVLEADKTAGAAPLRVVFSTAQTRDPEGDTPVFEIDFGDGAKPWKSDGAPGNLTIEHVFENAGVYEATLKATDPQGKWDTVKQHIEVGNEAPAVSWDLKGRNRSFYKPGDVLDYQIRVEDLEEGSLANGGIAPGDISTTLDYFETGFDINALNTKKQAGDARPEAYAKGKILADRSDCKTCHATDRQINGPAFEAIAGRYHKDPSAPLKLAHKIIYGGGGNWGATVMSPHPQISEADACEMARWILSLGAAPKPVQRLPVSGKRALSPKSKKPGAFILKAAYRDKGAKGRDPLEGSATLVLRPALQQAEQADSISKTAVLYRPLEDDVALLNLPNNAFFCFKRVDLAGLRAITLRLASGDPRRPYAGGRVELRLDAPGGAPAGQLDIPAPETSGHIKFTKNTLTVTASPDSTFHDLYFVFKNEKEPDRPVAAVDWVRFDLSPPNKTPPTTQ